MQPKGPVVFKPLTKDQRHAVETVRQREGIGFWKLPTVKEAAVFELDYLDTVITVAIVKCGIFFTRYINGVAILSPSDKHNPAKGAAIAFREALNDYPYTSLSVEDCLDEACRFATRVLSQMNEYAEEVAKEKEEKARVRELNTKIKVKGWKEQLVLPGRFIKVD